MEIVIQWLRPKLVAQIEFTEWTENNHLSHSRIIGLRDDKKAAEVIKEDLVAGRGADAPCPLPNL